MRLPLTAALAFALSLVPATAKAPADPKAEIAKVVTRQLKSGYGKHSPSEIRAAIQPADINGDGVPDWQVNFTAFGSAWCGTGGCRYQLWLGRKNGVPVRVFDRQMREVSTEQRGGRNVFVFDFHGSECGGFGSEACPGEFAWNSKRGQMVLLPTPARHTGVANPFVLF